MDQLRVSIESIGVYAEEMNRLMHLYISRIQGAEPYLRQSGRFITDMVPASCVEQEGTPPHFSIFVYVEERSEVLFVSLIALRINRNIPGITDCVFHDVQVVRAYELEAVCEDFAWHVADDLGGIRWQQEYDRAVRELLDR